jgi:hypothetical protein
MMLSYRAVAVTLPGEMMRLTVAVIALLLSSFALTQQPVPKSAGPGGSCPHGYTASGSFCVPSWCAGRDSVATKRQLPACWTRSGSFCLGSGNNHHNPPPAPEGRHTHVV